MNPPNTSDRMDDPAFDAFYYANDPVYREVVLERREYLAQVALDQEQLEWCRRTAHREQILDEANHQLLLRLRASVYGLEHPKKHVVEYPKTWWDAVKVRFAPAWFLRKWPAEYVVVTASLSETYPGLKQSIPDQAPVWRIALLNSTTRSPKAIHAY